MKELKIMMYPTDVLKRRSDEITTFDDDLKNLVDSMVEVMYLNSGVGLAAPQVGLNKRIIVVDRTSGEKNDTLFVMINPRVQWRSQNTVSSVEGCLSIPGVQCEIERNEEISLTYQDVTGQTHDAILTGYTSRIVQHELDHLDGIVMLDRKRSDTTTLGIKIESAPVAYENVT